MILTWHGLTHWLGALAKLFEYNKYVVSLQAGWSEEGIRQVGIGL